MDNPDLTPDDWSAVAEARQMIIEQLQSQLCREQEKLKLENEKTVRDNIAYLIRENSALRAAMLDLLRHSPSAGDILLAVLASGCTLEQQNKMMPIVEQLRDAQARARKTLQAGFSNCERLTP